MIDLKIDVLKKLADMTDLPLFRANSPGIFFLQGKEYLIQDIKILSNFNHGDWHYIRVLDKKYISDTYVIRSDDDTEYVLKFIKGFKRNNSEDILDEISGQQIASVNNLAPKIVLAFLFSKGAIIIMEKLDVNMGTFLVNNVDSQIYSMILMEIYAIVDKLHSVGVSHQDFTINNLMVKISKPDATGSSKFKKFRAMSVKVYAIDFGMCIIKNCGTSEQAMIKDFENLAGSVMDLYNDFQLPELKNMYTMIRRYIRRRFD